MMRPLLRTTTPLLLLLLLTAVLTTAPARAAPAEPASSAPPAAAPASSPAPAPASPAKPADESFENVERVRPETSFATIASVGILPASAFGVSAGFGFRWRFASLGAEGRYLHTPSFLLVKERAATAQILLGLLNACINHQGNLPLGIDAWQACAVAGAGAFSLVPVEESPGSSLAAVRPLMAIVGPRLGVAWQVSSGIYIKTFFEFHASLARVNLTFNGREKSDAFSVVGGLFGLQLSAVLNQPARWNRPAAMRAAVAR